MKRSSKSSVFRRVVTGVLFCSLFLNGIFLVVSYERTRVTAVPDGDSLDLQDGRRVRLLGLDAPEKGDCLYQEAKARLSERVLGRHVRLKDTVKDDYGRILANVVMDAPLHEWAGYLYARFVKKERYRPSAFVNGLMVEEGLARYTFVSSQYSGWLKRVHEEAKAGAKGIYSGACRQIIAPDPACAIKGNVRAGVKTYHAKACGNYLQTVVDLSFGDRWFCTEEEAEKAGFEKAAGCR